MKQYEKCFRGYVFGRSKKSIERHKGIDKLRSLEEVSSSKKDFGGLLTPGYIDISFDDPLMSKIIVDIAEKLDWRCSILENPTSKHVHTYWKKPLNYDGVDGEDKTLACGMIADFHSGETYIPLRADGVLRKWVYTINDNEDYQEVPEELLPVSTNIQLWQSKEGDGRNNDLYRYILVLQSQLRLSDDRIRDLYREIINPFVLADKLSEDELNVILREESFDKRPLPSFYVGSSFQHNKFGDFLIQNDHIIRLDGQLHIFHNGSYTNNLDTIAMVMRSYVPKLKKSQKAEVLDYLSDMAPVRTESEAHYIAFNNGVLNVDSGVLAEPSPDYVISNIIPWDYVPGAYNALSDHTLNRIACNDDRIRKLLEECIGYCFYRSSIYNKAFILTGERSNGKSTFLKVLTAVLGEENVSALDLKNLGDRFSKASLYKKLANIGDDISDDFIPDTSLFKKITDGGRIEAEYKGQKPFDFSPYSKLIFSANDIPRMKDKTGAVLRRLVIIPFNAKFSAADADYDPDITRKLTEQDSIEYLIRIGVEGLQRLMKQKDFTHSDKVEAERTEYNIENNPVLAFLADQEESAVLNQPTSEVYRRYQVFCSENGFQAVNNISFSKQVNRELGTRTALGHLGKGKDRKTFKCFVR